jgi:hypothetical protein
LLAKHNEVAYWKIKLGMGKECLAQTHQCPADLLAKHNAGPSEDLVNVVEIGNDHLAQARPRGTECWQSTMHNAGLSNHVINVETDCSMSSGWGMGNEHPVQAYQWRADLLAKDNAGLSGDLVIIEADCLIRRDGERALSPGLPMAD